MTLAQRWADYRRPRPHPLTGDMLSPTERLIWHIMSQYRRLRWFVFLQVLTIAWWAWPRAFPGGSNGWMLLWSDLAIVVEQLAGIAFLNQMIRDSVVTRAAMKEISEDTRLIREIHDALCPGQPGQVTVRTAAGFSPLELRPAPRKGDHA